MLATQVLTEPVPHHVSAGGDRAWKGSHTRKELCGTMPCMVEQRAWALLLFLEHPREARKGGCGERCPQAFLPLQLGCW